jgi:hypothetical protein
MKDALYVVIALAAVAFLIVRQRRSDRFDSARCSFLWRSASTAPSC